MNFQKNLHPSKVPSGTVFTGRIFSKNLVFPHTPQVFEYGKVRRWVLRTDKKKVMETKKNEYRKMTGKEQEAGLAAWIDSANKSHCHNTIRN